jgi:hypothetical protein
VVGTGSGRERERDMTGEGVIWGEGRGAQELVEGPPM